MKPLRFLMILLILSISAMQFSHAQSGSPSKAFRVWQENSMNVAIIWTSGKPDIFLESIEPYCEACFTNNDHEDLTLIAWGSSVDLLAKDAAIREELASLIEMGVKVKASATLAAKYDCNEKLKEIGVEITDINKLLTEFLRDEARRIVSL
ncbi:MAG: hypothetical protein KGY69_05600 [Bacteroidales bacterium]|nr:hypothetical protein [Bacteroidales bacterium]